MPDNDDNPYQLVKTKTFGYQLKLKEIKLGSQPLPRYTDPPSVWLVPMDLQIIRFGQIDMIKLTGKVLGETYRRNYLTQASDPPSDSSVGLSLYTDNTPDFMTRNDQFSAGFTGFGFKGEGQLFIQGGASHPSDMLGSFGMSPTPAVKYDSYQFTISTGTLPLAILKRYNMGITPQVGVDVQTGKTTLGLDLEFKRKFIKSINLNVNNINPDLKGKILMDSATVVFTFPFP